MTWQKYDGFQEILGKACAITLEPRPSYCDRGNWIAKIHVEPHNRLTVYIDGQDGWPRYFFDEERAKLECEAWLKKRGQYVRSPRSKGRRLRAKARDIP